jgi:hypothetical protein
MDECTANTCRGNLLWGQFFHQASDTKSPESSRSETTAHLTDSVPLNTFPSFPRYTVLVCLKSFPSLFTRYILRTGDAFPAKTSFRLIQSPF